MNKFFDTITNLNGDSLPGARAQVFDSAGSIVTIYADDSETRFQDADGSFINYATADSNGIVEFYWTPADDQVLSILDSAGNSLYEIKDFSRIGPAGPAGPTGADGLAAKSADFEFYAGSPSVYRKGRQVSVQDELSVLTRASSATLQRGGQTYYEGVNEAQIGGNLLHLDAGGTNFARYSDDMSQSDWTKDAVGTPVLTDGPGGKDTAWFVPETATTANHNLRQTTTVLSGTDFIQYAIVRPHGREYMQFSMFNTAAANMIACRYHLSGEGSILTNYPAVGAGSPTNLDAGIFKWSNGYYFCWVSGTFPTSTSFLPYFYFMENSTTTSYAGDTSKGMDVAHLCIGTGRVPFRPILTGALTSPVGTSRSAETFEVPLPIGNYQTRVVNEDTTVFAPLQVASAADKFAITPPSKKLAIKEAQAYELDLLDLMDRSDTADGTLGTATDGNSYSLRQYTGAYPMTVSTKGRVEGNWFVVTPTSGNDGTVYAVFDMGAGNACKSMSCTVEFETHASPGGDAISNGTAALLMSPDLDRLIEYMPIHGVFTRSAFSMQNRLLDGTFPVNGTIEYGTAKSRDVEIPIALSIFDDVVSLSVDGVEETFQNTEFAVPCRYVCFEIQTTSNNTTGIPKIKNFTASQSPVGYASPHIPVAPTNLAAPTVLPTNANYNAGQVFSVANAKGDWKNNNGSITYTYQWKLNGSNISGATSSSVDGVAESFSASDTLACEVTATNSTGGTTVSTATETLT